MVAKARLDITARDRTQVAIRSAQRNFRGLERGIGNLAGSLLLLGGSAGFGFAIRRSIEFADNIGKTADKVGVSTDALQKYRFAARRVGVEQRALDLGLQRFSRRLGEAAVGQGELVKLLGQYNIAIRDQKGNIRSTEEVLLDYADAVKAAGSSQEELRQAFKGFDSEGAALVNLFRGGREAIEGYGDEAKELGVILEEQLIRNAERANDRIQDLNTVLQVRFASVVADNAGSIESLATSIINLVDAIGRFGREAKEGYQFLIGDTSNRNVAEVQSIRLFEEELEIRQRINSLEESIAARRANKLPTNTLDAEIAELRAQANTLQQARVVLQEEQKARELAANVDAAGGTPPPQGTVDIPEDKKEKAVSAETIRASDQIYERFTDDDGIDQVRLLQNFEEAYREALARIESSNDTFFTEQEKDFLESQGRRLEEAAKVEEERTKKLQAELKKQTVFAEQAARNMQDQFAQFLFDPFDDGLKGMLQGFIDTIRNMVAQAAAAQIFGALNVGGFLAGGFLTGKAAGGPVSAGSPYIVGEKGPELFLPRSSGTVIPNGQMGGVVVNQSIDARGNDNPAEILALMPQFAEAIKRDMRDDRRRGL